MPLGYPDRQPDEGDVALLGAVGVCDSIFNGQKTLAASAKAVTKATGFSKLTIEEILDIG